jgi:hypothetical protein
MKYYIYTHTILVRPKNLGKKNVNVEKKTSKKKKKKLQKKFSKKKYL